MNIFLLALGCVVNAQEFSDVKEMMEFNVARWKLRYLISDLRYEILDSTHPVSDIGWWEQMGVHLVPCQGPGFQGQQLSRSVIVFTYLFSVWNPFTPDFLKLNKQGWLLRQLNSVEQTSEIWAASYAFVKTIGPDGRLLAFTLFPRAYAGERIFGSGVPIGGEDMYILGSSGKSMTSTMAARVVAKGYISWKTTTKEIFQDTVRGLDLFWKKGDLI